MLEEDLPITVSSFLQRPSWSCFRSQYRSHRWMNMIHLPHKNRGWSEKQSCFFRRGKDESRLFWFLKAKQEKSINKKEKYTYIIHTPNAPRLRKLHLENETKTYEVLQQSSLMILQGPTNNLWALCSIHYRACILNVTIISQKRERENAWKIVFEKNTRAGWQNFGGVIQRFSHKFFRQICHNACFTQHK